MDEENLRRHLALLLHELQMPVVAMRASIEFAREEIAKQNIKLQHHYLDDAWHYSELLGTIIRNAAILRDADRPITSDRIERVSFLAGVIYPAIQSVEPLLRERLETRSAIALNNVDTIPPLYIDRQQMQLVFYNLLTNAIKYSQPHDVHINIAASVDVDGWTVSIADWGIGIDQNEAEDIFKMGYRGRRGLSQVVSGSGVGLYITKSILTSHECAFKLVSSNNPTEFRIYFPKRLAERTSAK
jgi:signal transduction histidine kinase